MATLPPREPIGICPAPVRPTGNCWGSTVMSDLVKGQSALSDIELEEALAQQSLNRSMFSRLVPLVRPVRHFVLAAVGIEILLVGAVFTRPWLIRQAIDKGLVHRGGSLSVDTHVVALVAGGMVLAWIAR